MQHEPKTYTRVFVNDYFIEIVMTKKTSSKTELRYDPYDYYGQFKKHEINAVLFKSIGKISKL